MSTPTARRTIALVALVALVAGLAATAPAGADGNEAPGDPAAFRSITAGSAHTCVRQPDGDVKCWGANFYGQRGHGDPLTSVGDGAGEMGDDLPAVDLGTGRTATAISAGGYHTCALLDDATVKCWGRGDEGQLGQGNPDSLGDQAGELGDGLPAVDLGTNDLGADHTATAIAAGSFHTCALLDDGSVKCWGENTYGKLGLGAPGNRGDEPDEMGDLLPTVDLGTGRTAAAIAAGAYNTCALLDDATVKCWGFGNAGLLGLGDYNPDIGDGPDEMGDDLPAIDLGTDGLGAALGATAITIGYGHACAILDGGTLKCWGGADNGALGLGAFTVGNPGIGNQAGEMGDNLPAVDLGTDRTATAVSAGESLTCALLDDATVKCWGYGLNGALGQGNTASLGGGANQMGDDLPAVDLGTGHTALAVATGSGHVCAALEDATVKCWGYGSAGQLGQGASSNHGDGPDEMGDNLLTANFGIDPTVDLTAPADGVTIPRGRVVAAAYSCADEPGGSGIADPGGCVATPDLAPGSGVDTATLGEHTFAVTATDNGANTTTVSHTYTVANARPDSRIQRGTRLIGNNIYNNLTRQTVTGSATRGRSVTYYAPVQNDAPFNDTLRIRGQRSTSRFTVTYRNPAGDNITNRVIAGTYPTPALATGATHRIRITVTVRRTAPRGAALTRTLTTTSTTHPTQTDGVRFTTRRS